MSIIINCKVSLSKKLREILGTEGSVTLTTSNLPNGKGTGRLIFNNVEEVNIDVTEIGETSIMLTPVDTTDDMPTNETRVHGSIFTSIPGKGLKEKIVSKIAVVHPPEDSEISTAITDEIEIPECIKELKSSVCCEYVSNLNQLMSEVKKARNKKSSVDLNEAQNDRERAFMMAIKETEESIDIPAWIVNDKVGSLTINDMQIGLRMNMPIDLSKMSSKRIAASKDLRSLINAGYVKFISPEEKNAIIESIVEQEGTGLEVFSGPKEAKANMAKMDDEDEDENDVDDDDDIVLKDGLKKSSNNLIKIDTTTEDNAEELTEEESMVLNLTKNAPTTKKTVLSNVAVPKHTVHGNNIQTAPKNPAIKPIRKLED